ncbi:MAG: hypothetical protein ABR954_06540 [Dehalococcoidales bacterium]
MNLALKFVKEPKLFVRNLNAANLKKFLRYLRRMNALTLERKIDSRLRNYNPDSFEQVSTSAQSPPDVEGVLHERFVTLRPIHVFTIPRTERRLNMVTDSINSESLFGGVATAIILSALLADSWECDLRIITRTGKAEKRNFSLILQANGIPFFRNVEFLYVDYNDSMAEVPVGDGDVFLTTSWWTTKSVKDVLGEKRVIYLLQEDERTFYPFGDDHIRSTQILSSPGLQFIINTKLLYDYFVSQGFENIREHGLWFEPSWSQKLFYYDHREPKGKKNFFYYARPNNLRNLFYLGLEVIKIAATTGVLNPDEWNIYFVGNNIPPLCIRDGYNPHFCQNLNWSDYAALVRKMDLGLCLMYSPHPSYPPLDLAASGAVAVTARYSNKHSLNNYSRNILCCQLDVDSLVHGIENGVKLATNYHKRIRNYNKNRILRDWTISFNGILNKLKW